MLNFFETQKYVFVHSSIPIKKNISEWRSSSPEEWKSAMWGNPFELSERIQLLGKWKETFGNKTLVFGHFHTSFGWSVINGMGSEFESDAIFTPYYGKNYIGIDGCTAFTKKTNILIVEDNFL